MGEYQASPFSPDVHNSHIAKLVEQCQPRKRPGTRKEESLESTYQDAHQQHSSLPCINRNPSTPSFNSKHSVPRTSPPQIFLGDMANPAGRSSSSHMAAASLRATAGAICCHPSLPSPKAWQGDSGAGGCATEGTGRELEKPWKRKLASC